MKVRVHFNLHKAGLVVRNQPARTGDMRYVDKVCVRNARFTIAGGKCVSDIRKDKRRQVCAYIVGDLCDCGATDGADIAYNPFHNDGFVLRGTQSVVSTADHVGLEVINSKPITRARNAR